MPHQTELSIVKETLQKESSNDESVENLPTSTETKMIVSLPPVMTTAPPPPPPMPSKCMTFIPPLDVPEPKQKMKTLPWKSIPTLKDGSVWVDIKTDKGNNGNINYTKLEELFSCKICSAKQSSKEVKTYLDSKKAMRIGIFLKKFKMSPERVTALVTYGISKDMDYYSFRALKEHLPSENEAVTLKEICHDELSTLSIPDIFIAELVKLPNYEMYINAMVLQGELTEMDYIQNIVHAMENACESIMNSTAFKEFLKCVLEIGLFMNKGKVAGRAYGFNVLSLSELHRTKSKDDSTTLLEFIVRSITSSSQTHLDFMTEIKGPLDETQRFSLCQVKEEFCTLKKKRDEIINNISSKCDCKKADPETTECECKKQFQEFEKVTSSDIQRIEDAFKNVDTLSKRVAVFFGLDEINLDDLCDCFRKLCEHIEKILVKRREAKSKVSPRVKDRYKKCFSSHSIGQQTIDTKLQQKLATQKRRSESVT